MRADRLALSLLLGSATACAPNATPSSSATPSQDWRAYCGPGSGPERAPGRTLRGGGFLGIGDGTEKWVVVTPMRHPQWPDIDVAFHILDLGRGPRPGGVRIDSAGSVSDSTQLTAVAPIVFFGLGARMRAPSGDAVIGGAGLRTDVCGTDRAFDQWLTADSLREGWSVQPSR